MTAAMSRRHLARDHHALCGGYRDLLGQRARWFLEGIEPAGDAVARAQGFHLRADADHFAGKLGSDAARRTALRQQPELAFNELPVERVDADEARANHDHIARRLAASVGTSSNAQDIANRAERRIAQGAHCDRRWQAQKNA